MLLARARSAKTSFGKTFQEIRALNAFQVKKMWTMNFEASIDDIFTPRDNQIQVQCYTEFVQ